MKKLTENRAAALAILIIVALLAVPVLGGAGLTSKVRSSERQFSKTVTTPDRHGNDLISDTDKVVVSAEALLAEGTKLAGDSTEANERAKRLRSAIDAVSGAKSAIDRYENYESLTLEARQFANSLRGNTSEAFSTYLTDIESQSSRIERVYRSAYSEYTASVESLTSGFPASLIAKFLKIGGGK